MIPAAWRRGLLATWIAGVVVVAAIPAGGAGAGGQLVARLSAFFALALAALVYDGRPAVRRIALPLSGMAAVAAIGWLQSLAWPESWARLVSPAHAELTANARQLLAAEGVARTLSLAPGLSRAAALAVISTAAFLFAAFVGGQRRRHRRWLAIALVAGGVGQVVYGAREWLAGLAPRLRGTFVNPNHLAYELEISLAVAFAWAAWSARAQRHAPTLERRLALVAPPSACCLLLAAGLLATGSRAGLAAAAAGVLLQCLLLPRALGDGRHRLAAKALAAAALTVLVLLAAHGPGRLDETTLYEVAWGDRAVVWRRSIELWLRFPLTGSGLGTFGEAFPLVQPAEMTELYWRRAHNGALELLTTGGVVGLFLGVVTAAGAAWALTRVVRSGERSEDRAAALAGLGAVTAVATHESMDFGLTLPGVALPLVALVGAAAAARLTNRSREPGPDRDESAGGRRDRSPAGAPSSARR